MYFFIGLTVFGVFGSFTYYLPELFPTRLRGTGAGFCYNVGRCRRRRWARSWSGRSRRAAARRADQRDAPAVLGRPRAAGRRAAVALRLRDEGPRARLTGPSPTLSPLRGARGPERSSPCRSCTSADRRSGCCSPTRCRTSSPA